MIKKFLFATVLLMLCILFSGIAMAAPESPPGGINGVIGIDGFGTIEGADVSISTPFVNKSTTTNGVGVYGFVFDGAEYAENTTYAILANFSSANASYEVNSSLFPDFTGDINFNLTDSTAPTPAVISSVEEILNSSMATSEVNITFTAAEDNIWDNLSYFVMRGNDSGVDCDTGVLVDIFNSTESTISIIDDNTSLVPNGSTFYYVVCADDPSGNEGAESNVENITLTDRVPAQVENLTIDFLENGFNVTWNTLTNNSDGSAIQDLACYILYNKIDLGSWTVMDDCLTETYYTHIGLNNSQQLFYIVGASDDDDNYGANSTEVNETFTTAPTITFEILGTNYSNYIVNGTFINVSFASVGPNIDTIYFNVTNSTGDKIANETLAIDSSEGFLLVNTSDWEDDKNYTITAWVNDSLNRENEESTNFEIDITAPVIEIALVYDVTDGDMFYQTGQDVTIEVTFTDDIPVHISSNFSEIDAGANYTNLSVASSPFTISHTLVNSSELSIGSIIVGARDSLNNFHQDNSVDVTQIVVFNLGVPAGLIGDSTNFSEVFNMSEVDVVFETADGIINFTESLDISDYTNGSMLMELPDHLNINLTSTPPIIEFDSAWFMNLSNVTESPITLTWKGLNSSFSYNPIIFNDGVACDACNNFDFSTGDFTFTAVGFSNYTAESDAVAPSYTINSSGGSTVMTENQWFYANWSDLSMTYGNNLDVVLYKWNSTDWVESSATVANESQTYSNMTYTILQSEEGDSLKFKMQAFDGAGNNASTANFTFTVTDSIPLVTSLSPAHSSFTNNNASLISFEVADIGKGVNNLTIEVNLSGTIYNVTTSPAVLCSGTSASYACNLTPNEVSDGLQTIYVNVDDLAANSATEKNNNFTVDATAPVLAFIGPVDSSEVNSNTITLNLTDNGEVNISTVVVLLDGTASTIFNTSEHCVGSANYTCEYNETALAQGSNNITVSGSDSATNVGTPVSTIFTYDNVAPVIVVNGPLAGNHTTPVLLNWNVTDVTLDVDTIGYYIDDGSFVALTGFVNLTNVTMTPGNHTLIFSANDTLNNVINASGIELFLLTPINISDTLDNIQGNVSSVILNNVTLSDDSGNTDYSSEETFYVNQTLELEMNVNVSNIDSVVEFDFHGDDVDWNSSSNFSINVNATSGEADAIVVNAGASVDSLLLFINMSHFIADDMYSNGVTIFFDEALNNRDVLYIEDDAGTSVYVLDECSEGSAPSVINLTTMCYLNTSTNITLYVPHLSGGALANDTFAPNVTLSSPANNSEQDNSFFDFNFTVIEANPADEFCTYQVFNGSENVTDEIIESSDLTWVGTAGTYAGTLSNLADDNYNLTLTCVDLNDNSTTIVHNFSVADTTKPTVSLASVSNSGTTTVTTTLAVTTDEAAVCKFGSTEDNTTNVSTAYVNLSDSMTGATTAHTATKTYTVDTTGFYYIRCNDTAGNVMTSSTNVSFDADVTAANSGGSSGGSSSSYTHIKTLDSNGLIVTMNKADMVKFDVGTVTHKFKIISVDTTARTVMVQIQSDPIVAELVEGVPQDFDLDSDGVLDVRVLVYEIVNFNRAKVIFSEAPLPVVKPTIELLPPKKAENKNVQTPVVEVPESVSSDEVTKPLAEVEPTKSDEASSTNTEVSDEPAPAEIEYSNGSFLSKYGLWILIIVVLALIVGAFYVSKPKKLV
ncbi:hypothetical protein HN587_02370 [Candidatus Woesearchaeota archaeon]|jgi:hypothetical protein|nr:hypothetical protein [Candidatus Woesearchaeota archaeon]